MKELTIASIERAMIHRGYCVFNGLYNLNIVGIRSEWNAPDHFDDYICVFYDAPENGGLRRLLHVFSATTDPGLPWLKNPMNSKGCAVLKPGQYKGMWKMGLHHGREALIQVNPCTVYRDANRDNVIDGAGTGTIEDTGLFGIDMHDAGNDAITVGKWSAGCQVTKRKCDMNFILWLAQKQEVSKKGDHFTYTLLESNSL